METRLSRRFQSDTRHPNALRRWRDWRQAKFRCRIIPKPLGVVHDLIVGLSPEYRPPRHTDKRMSAVLAGAGVGERFGR